MTAPEVLLIAACMALLLGVAAPGLPKIKSISRVTLCFDNLRQLGEISAQIATADSRGVPHRQATTGARNWIGLGAWDWGGRDGTEYPSYADNTNYHLGAANRPYNAYSDPNIDMPLYECPDDTGFLAGGGYGDDSDALRASVFRALGNSYQGDFIWFSGGSGAEYTALRFGSFQRGNAYFVNAAETLLFYEARFAQAYLATREAAEANLVEWGEASVPSWHGGFRYNALLSDGHAVEIELRSSSSMYDVRRYSASSFPFRSGMIRGNGWRYDAFPERFVYEGFNGIPTVEPPPPLMESSTESAIDNEATVARPTVFGPATLNP